MDETKNVNESADKEVKLIAENNSARKGISNITIELSGNTNEIPNTVQTVEDIAEVEKTEKLGLTTDGYIANVHKLRPPVIQGTKNVDDTAELQNSGGWQRLTKQKTNQNMEKNLSDINGEQDITQIENKTVPKRKGSLSVPAFSALLKDDKQESNVSNVRKASKFSIMSPISLQLKNDDLRAIQMPSDEKSSVFPQEDSWIRVAIPYLPLWVAVVCLVMNIVISGSGTVLSGLCFLCCAKHRVPTKYDPDPILLLCVNIWVGLAQLFTVTFLLVGWFWSIAWGIRMVVLSLEYRDELKEQRATQLKEQALSAFGKALALKK